MIIEFILCGITLIAIILLVDVICYNKIKFSIIKIEEAEKNIEIYLDKKYEYLKRVAPLINKEVKDLNYFKDFDKNMKKANQFELSDALKDSYSQLLKIMDDNEKLFSVEAIKAILKDLRFNETELNAAIKYYNDSVAVFNHLVTSFPSNFVAFLCRYKAKSFYNDEKKEIYDILNER